MTERPYTDEERQEHAAAGFPLARDATYGGSSICTAVQFERGLPLFVTDYGYAWPLDETTTLTVWLEEPARAKV